MRRDSVRLREPNVGPQPLPTRLPPPPRRRSSREREQQKRTNVVFVDRWRDPGGRRARRAPTNGHDHGHHLRGGGEPEQQPPTLRRGHYEPGAQPNLGLFRDPHCVDAEAEAARSRRTGGRGLTTNFSFYNIIRIFT